jgi:hypothetical protein
MLVDYDRGGTWIAFSYGFLKCVDSYDFDIGGDVFLVEDILQAP